jgi:hypothetical protein
MGQEIIIPILLVIIFLMGIKIMSSPRCEKCPVCKSDGIISVIKTKDPALNEKIERIRIDILSLVKMGKTDLCKMKDILIVMINSVKFKPGTGVGGTDMLCSSKFTEQFDLETNNMLAELQREGVPNNKKVKLIIIRNNLRDSLSHVLTSYFCEDGKLLVNELKKYLVNVVNQICSDNDSTFSNIADTASYYLFKPMEYL